MLEGKFLAALAESGLRTLVDNASEGGALDWEREAIEVGDAEYQSAADLPEMLARKERRTRPYLDLDDLVSAGNLGLTLALRDYDPERGVPFRAYAHYRVRYAILDEIRTLTRLHVRHPLVVSPDLAGRPHHDPPGVDTAEHATPVLHALDQLAERDKRIVLLHAAGFTLNEIGKQEGVTEARASTLRARALRRFEDQLAA